MFGSELVLSKVSNETNLSSDHEAGVLPTVLTTVLTTQVVGPGLHGLCQHILKSNILVSPLNQVARLHLGMH